MLFFYYDIPPYRVADHELEKMTMDAAIRGENNDQNEYGEKYELKELDNNLGILKISVIVGIFSCFCSFSAQSG